MDNEKDKTISTSKNVGLKVTGILIGIIAGIALLTWIFCKTILPMWIYNNAINSANQGKYEDAYYALTAKVLGNNYKDSAEKKGEYALKTAKEYLENEDFEKAIDYCKIAYSSLNEEASQLSREFFFVIGERYFSEGRFEDAKEYFNIAVTSDNPEIKEKAQAYLATPGLK